MTLEKKEHIIEVWDLERLIPYEANAKKHPQVQIEKLATAIQKFGWTQPIVVAGNGEIIAGHGRRLAAIHLGLSRVPVICRRDLSKADCDKLRLADNRVTSTEYDQTLIQDELRRLSEEIGDISLSDMGFDAREIDFTMADLGDIDESFFVDDVSEAVEEQKQKNEDSVRDTDETAAPVVDSLGFKRVTISQGRSIREAMKKIERTTGKTGAEAFVEFMSGI